RPRGPPPLVGPVGLLRSAVRLRRLEHEYGVKAKLGPRPYRHARWVEGPAARIEELASYERALVYDTKGRPLLLFDSDWSLRVTLEKATDVAFHDVAP